MERDEPLKLPYIDLVDLRIDWADDPIGMLRAAWEVYAPQMHAYVQRAEDPTKAPSYRVPGDEYQRIRRELERSG